MTTLGYKISQIPPDILQVIKDEKLDEPHDYCSKNTAKAINCQKVDSKGEFVSKNNVFTFEFGSRSKVSKLVENLVRPQIEDWMKVKLAHGMLFYGIRRYTRGAKLFSHIDTLPDHLIGVILQVDQKVDQDWPLTLLNHQNEYQEIILKPGQMVFYEGAAIPHGRPYSLNGDYYDNMFVHFTLENPELKKLKQDVDDYIVNKAKIKDEL